MSEIRIEKKNEKNNFFPWILGLIIASLAIWGIAEFFDETEEFVENEKIENVDITSDRANEGNELISSSLAFEREDIGLNFISLTKEYEDFTSNMTGEMGLDHEFSHNALMQLSNITSTLAQSYGLEDEADLVRFTASIKESADGITKDPFADTHADMIKHAAIGITNVLEVIQMDKFPALENEIADVRMAAKDIDKSTLTLNQKEDVRDFFGKTRVALIAMRTAVESGQH